jgi:hypothetical protein
MNETLSGMGGGVFGVIGALGMGALWYLVNKRKTDASDGADIASDNARGGTYEMLSAENRSLMTENKQQREKISELERIDSLRDTQLRFMRRDFAIYKQMVTDGVSTELANKYVQHSALAELDSEPGKLK